MKNQRYISGREIVCNFYIRVEHKTIFKLFHFFQLKCQMSVFVIKILMNKLSAYNEVHTREDTAIIAHVKNILSPLLHIILSSSKFQEASWKIKKKPRRHEDVFSGLQMKIMASVVFAPDRTRALGKVWRQEEVGRALHLIYLKTSIISYFSLSTRILLQLQTSHGRGSNPLIVTAATEPTTHPQSAQHWVLIRAAGRVLTPAEKVPTLWRWHKVWGLPGKFVSKYWISFKRWSLVIWPCTMLFFS